MSNPADPRFRDVEAQYAALKAQLAAGQVTREQFEAALQAQMILDAQGRYWMIGAESGRWYIHDGQNWVQQDPPGGAPVAAPPPPPTPDEHRAARADSATLSSFIPPQIPKTSQPDLRPDQAQTLVGFTPPVIPPKATGPAARPDAQTMVGFTPPTIPPTTGMTGAPTAPPQTGEPPRRAGLSPALIMAIIFLFVCVVGLAALGWAVASRFAPDQAPIPTTAPTSVAAVATSVPTTAPATATNVPPAATPTAVPPATSAPAIPTISIIARPSSTPTVAATATSVPPSATATNVPPTATATNPPPPPPTRTPTPQFSLTFAFQGYERWGQPDPNDCTLFNNKIPVRQFKWDAFLTNRSSSTIAPSEWTTQAFNDKGGSARVCVSNLPNIPAGQTAKTTWVAFVNSDQFVARVVHTVRGTPVQRCLDAAWKETDC